MGAVGFRLRAEARTRWKAWLAVAVLAGIGAGTILGVVAGARRTASAYPRMVEAQDPVDVLVFPGDPEELALLPRLRTVESTIELQQFTSISDTERRPGGFASYPAPIAPGDERAAAVLERAKLVAGRRADPTIADEVVLGVGVAEGGGLEVGDRLGLSFLREEELDAFFEGGLGLGPLDVGTRRELEVVGIVAAAGDLPPRPFGAGLGYVYLTPAFLDEAMSSGLAVDEGAGLRLGPGTDLDDFYAEVEGLTGQDVRGLVEPLEERHLGTREALETPARVLWLLVGLGAVAALVVLGQGLGRLLLLESADHPVLGALGLGRGQLVALGLARAATIGVAAAVVAVLLAIALSPHFPFGLAGQAEPDPGLQVDLLALGLGALAVVTATIGVAVVPAVRAARWSRRRSAFREATRASRIVAWLASTGARPPVVAGARLALEPGRGPGAVPVRSTVVGAAVGITVLAGAFSFGAGLDRLLDTPRLYGWGWDAQFGDGFGEDYYAELEEDLQGPDIDAVAVGTTARLRVEGRPVDALALRAERGLVEPTVTDGAGPLAAQELLLGARALDQLDVEVGDQVDVEVSNLYADGQQVENAPTRRLRVAGRAITPERLGVRLGEGAVLDLDTLTELSNRPDVNRNMVFVRFAPGVDPEQGLADLPNAPRWTTALPPEDLVNFGRVEAAPDLIAGLMAVVATALLGATLLSAVRRRRRDLALLKTLGFVRRQVSGSVAVQAMLLGGAALLIGLPVGTALGRWGWLAFADGIQVLPEPAVPVLALALVVPGALLVANLAAAAPAWAARRTSPSTVLRSE